MKCFMKKSKCVLLFLFGVGIGIIGSAVFYKLDNSSRKIVLDYIDKGEYINGDTVSFENPNNYGYLPDSGFVPNAKVAYDVAMAILKPIYGQGQILHEKPYEIILENKKNWFIKGTKDNTSKGSVVTITIRKKDGRVILVSHGK